SPRVIRFGLFEADLAAGELRKNGLQVKLQNRPFEILSILLEHPGEVISREEFRRRLWPADTFVDFDHSLNASINKLRQALDDFADNPRFVATVGRRGYRFIAPVGGPGQHAEPPATAVAEEKPPVASTSVSVAQPVASGAAPAEAPAAIAPRPKRARSRFLVAGLAIFAIAAVVTLILSRTRSQAVLTEADSILISDFVNTTGEPIFDDTLKQALRVQLEQSPFLNVLSDQEVEQELTLMRRPAGQPLTADIARDLCQRVASKAVLTGSITSLGSHYAIGLSAFDCQTGKGLASEQAEADDREHVLKALGNAATRMRKRLGESLASVQKYDAPIEQATTPSLEALKVYSLGRKASAASEWAAAVPFFQRAISLDPDFALAYRWLGNSYKNLGETTLGLQNISKAYELRERVSEPERFYIEAHFYQYVTGNLEKARTVYQLWAQTYPRDFRPMPPLFAIYTFLGR